MLAVWFCWFQLPAQWVSNPAENTHLSSLSGEQVLPKIAVCDNGYAYVSWFSSEEGNYNVRLQYLDPDGNAMWADNGLLVSDEPQMSWLTDWDLTVDASGNAVVVFQDIREVDNNPVAYCVSPEGEMLWGENGVMLSNNANFEPNPKVCATDNGSAVFAWQSEAASASEVHLQKVSPAGALLWGDGIILSGSEEYTFPFLSPAGGEQVFLIWHKESGPFWAPNRGMYVQLLDADGNFVWETAAEAYAPVPSGPVISLQMCSDGMGGLIFTWYRNDTGLHFHSYVQHMDAGGNMSMPAGGALVSTSTSQNHMYPAPAWMSATQEIVVFFSEQDMNQNQRGLYAQKFDLDGNRQWTDNGKELIALSNNDYSLIMAAGYPDKAISVYEAYEFGNASDTKIQAVMLDGEGNFVWEQEFIDMSTFQSPKLHPELSQHYFGQWVCVWEDQRNDGGDIYAQNIQPDGTLGPVITAIGKPGMKGNPVSLFPNPCTDKVVVTGEIPEGSTATIGIYDLIGQLVLEKHFTIGSDDIVHTDALNSGIYFYIINHNQDMYSGKLIKK